MNTIWHDNKRTLYMDGDEAILAYNGERYTFGCQPYEPMTLIYRNGKTAGTIHNSFRVSDECEVLLRGQLVRTITGKYHNAERLARLLTTALDTGCDDIGEVEKRMMEQLTEDKGAENIEYASYDFKRTKVLYEGVALLLGYFDCNITKVYALAFGYPNPHGDMYEYYLISAEEYKQYKQWPEHKEWKSHEAAYEWHEAHLANRQVLCNEFSHMKKTYKPFFCIRELA